MRIVGRFAAVSLSVVIGFTLAGPVRAQEVQTGNNSANSNQSGEDQSGDAIGGQVNGVVANGNTSVDAKNTTSDSDVRSGDAFGANESSSFTGLKTQESGGPASN